MPRDAIPRTANVTLSSPSSVGRGVKTCHASRREVPRYCRSKSNQTLKLVCDVIVNGRLCAVAKHVVKDIAKDIVWGPMGV